MRLDELDAQRLELIANTLPVLLAYVDGQARYVWVNEAYRRWFGDAPESFRGRHVREILGESGWSTIAPYVTRALAGEEVSFERSVASDRGRAEMSESPISPIATRAGTSGASWRS
jgi:PAS domain S-box-containing protein